MNTLGLEPEDFHTLQDILKKYPITVDAYGSRARGTHRRFSDIDLCVEGSDDRLLSALREDLWASSLPIKVDLLAFESLSPHFLEHIRKDFVRIQTAENQTF